LGVALLPRSALVETERLAIIDLTRPRLQRRTALAWRQQTSSPAGRAFLALAQTRLTA
jgi:LysR substrate binding domain